MKNSRRQSNLSFRLMAIEFRCRDLLHPPIKILDDAGVRSGMKVLDFGCGPGSFSVAAAEVVGPKGVVYAVDIHPLALKAVQKTAQRRGFNNVRAVPGEGMAGIDGGTIDVVLLYDVLHDLAEPDLILAELHRVLTPNGVLSVSDHHTEETALQSMIIGSGLYRLGGRTKSTFQFEKIGTGKVVK